MAFHETSRDHEHISREIFRLSKWDPINMKLNLWIFPEHVVFFLATLSVHLIFHFARTVVPLTKVTTFSFIAETNQ